jgi:hypothetical protein
MEVKWNNEIQSSLVFHEKFFRAGETAWKKYSSSIYTSKQSYSHTTSLIWANIQIMLPTLLYSTPIVQVRRRLKNSDVISKEACQCAEDVGNFYVDIGDFYKSARSAVLDYLVVGRGVLWNEYIATFEKTKQILQIDENGLYHNGQSYIDDYDFDDNGQAYVEIETIAEELVKVTKPHWRDFIHSPARVWDEVAWVARAIYLTKPEAKEKFGEKATGLIYFDESANSETYKTSESFQKTKIWEVWDKTSKKVIYASESSSGALLVRDPMISFTNFFPCSEPLFSTQSEDSILPIPDCLQYDQLHDSFQMLVERFGKLAEKVKWSGIYNKRYNVSLGKILKSSGQLWEPEEAFDQIAALGGISGAMLPIPFEQIASVLQTLTQTIDYNKQLIYEISGVGEIMRAQSDPLKTATASEIEDERGDMRVADAQKLVTSFLKNTIRLVVESAFETVSPDTLGQICGKSYEDETYQQALELLKNDKLRTFVIEVETDSTIKRSRKREKELAIEFGNLAREWSLQLPQLTPSILPIYKDLMMFVVRRFEQGRELEEPIEEALVQLVQQATTPPPPPPPDPMLELAHRDMSIKEAKSQADIQKIQAEIMRMMEELKLKQTELAHDMSTGENVSVSI